MSMVTYEWALKFCIHEELRKSNIRHNPDPNAIYRIVNNIVENAIKFTDPDGEVLISLAFFSYVLKRAGYDN